MAKLATGRTLAEFKGDNDTLYPAEQLLLDGVARGRLVSLDDKRPKTKTDVNCVRAEFLRFLALGGDDDAPVHERGIHLEGAWIIGALDLQSCSVRAIELRCCTIEGELTIYHADLRDFSVERSLVHGIAGDGMRCRGSFHFRDGSRSFGMVSIAGARIDGDLDFTSAHLENSHGNALYCAQAQIGGDVFLRKSGERDDFLAIGEVDLARVSVGGDLECSGGRFHNPRATAISCDGAQIQGTASFDNCEFVGAVLFAGFRGHRDLDFSRSDFGTVTPTAEAHLVLSRARITGDLVFRRVTGMIRGFWLRGASVGGLVDDLASWLIVHNLVLDGFCYTRFSDLDESVMSAGVRHYSATDANSRIKWLDRQVPSDLIQNFKPQPWEQLIHVLRAMGHEDDAKRVAIEKQTRMRRLGTISRLGSILHWFFGKFIGYGYRPLRGAVYIAIVWLCLGAFYDHMAQRGVFAPTDARIFTDPRFEPCRLEHGGNWTTCHFNPIEYTTFNAFAFSLDLILPLVGLSQDKDWAPVVQRPRQGHTVRSDLRDNVTGLTRSISSPISEPWLLGWITRFVVWCEILFGWIASLMLAAVLGGLVKKD
jgi:hypothetical protein